MLRYYYRITILLSSFLFPSAASFITPHIHLQGLKTKIQTPTRTKTIENSNNILSKMTKNDIVTGSNFWTTSTNDAAQARDELKVWPLDEYNTKLLNEVHPKDWPSSTKSNIEEYDLVVIGAGAGGLVSSRQAARRGAKSVMISAHLAGGDCLNVGCVPSKALIRSAKMIREVKKAQSSNNEFGIKIKGEVEVDFLQIMKRMRKLRAQIAPVDGHALGTNIGVTVLQGFGRFVDEKTVEVVQPGSSETRSLLRFKKAVIATGGRASIVPNIPGLSDSPYTTNETLFNLSKLPPRMVILGSGVIALEMAQTFSTFGTKVTVLVRGENLFPRADPDVGPMMKRVLAEDGVTFLTNSKITQVETLKVPSDEADLPLMKVSIKSGNENIELDCECLLVAAGRAPNVENLNLEAANVQYDLKEGIIVNDFAQSASNPNVYAVGDCTAGVPRLTHMSGEMAKVVVQNSLFDDEWRLSSLVVPACMYTEPEYASVGIVNANSDEVDIYTASLEHNDRAILESDNDYGYAKVFCKKGTGTIVGCTIVASRAGEIINEVTLAMKHGVPLEGIGRNIHSYPTTGEAVMMCGLQLINSKWKRLD